MESRTTSRSRSKRPNGTGGYWYSAKEGRYRAQYQDDSGRTRSLSAKTEEAITRKLVEATNARDMGALGGLPTNIPTVGQWLDRWLEASTHLAPATRDRYALDINKRIKPFLGGVRLDKVTPSTVESMYRRSESSGLSANTVRHVHAVLRTAYREAFRLGVVVVNVMDRVRAPKARAKEIHPMTLDQAKQILAAAQAHGAREYARWALAMRYGPRQGEVLGLRWSDIDPATGRIQIRQALQRQSGTGLVFRNPKSRAGLRAFFVDPDTLSALTLWRQEQVHRRLAAPSWEFHDLVFTTDRGTPIDPRNDYRQWRQLLEVCGLEGFRIHDCRHTAATYLLQYGTSERALMEILGHSQISLTMNTYAHVTAESLQEAAGRVAEMYR